MSLRGFTLLRRFCGVCISFCILHWKQMYLIPVIDLLDGRAVHARGGRRSDYRPVASALGVDISGDPIALARLYVERLGLRDLYVADLDAIEGASPQDVLVAAVAQLGAAVWVDAGVTSVAHARHILRTGASRVIVGLETLQSFGQLHDICADVGGEHVAFSLDVRGGVPVIAKTASIPTNTPEAIAASAVDAGVSAVIVLDLERVGSAAGVDLSLLAAVRRAVPGVLLLAGGGVRGNDDLSRLVDAGCDGALVATALHSGAIDPRAPR
jgi:phosphoribosylformimino-5-aminoimidazole carboxamide ribotide isomerase